MSEKRRIKRERRPVSMKQDSYENDMEVDNSPVYQQNETIESVNVNEIGMEADSYDSGYLNELNDSSLYEKEPNKVPFDNVVKEGNNKSKKKKKKGKMFFFVLLAIIVLAGSLFGAVRYSEYIMNSSKSLFKSPDQSIEVTTIDDKQDVSDTKSEVKTAVNIEDVENNPVQILWPTDFVAGNYEIKLDPVTGNPRFFLSGSKKGLGTVIREYDGENGDLKNFWVIINDGIPNTSQPNNSSDNIEGEENTDE